MISQRGLPLEPWHTHVPHELSREKLDAANWTEYLAAEAKIFDDDSSARYPGSSMRPIVCRPIGILRAVRSVRDTLRRISIVRLCWSRRKAGRCYRASAWPEWTPLQSAPYCRIFISDQGLCGCLCRDAGAWRRSCRPDRRGVGRLDGGDAARGTRSAQPHRAVRAAASG